VASRVQRSRRAKPVPGQPDGWEVPAVPAPPPFEDVLYRILRDSFNRSDAAARAVARLDYQLALQQSREVEEPKEPTVPQEGGAALLRGSGEFDDREFVETFERLSFLRLTIDLLRVLDLQDLKEELLSALIEERFRSKPHPTGRAAPETATVSGSDMSVLVHNLKRVAERRARQSHKPARTAVK
jgi:hypothetical protein